MSGDVRWLAENRVEGVVMGRVGRSGQDLVAEWVGIARLVVKRDGTDVRFEHEPGAPPEALEKIRRGSARLLLRHLAGHLALHGGAVEMGGAAVALLGDSGAGKSTLVASLCMAHGATLLADDAVALERAPAGAGSGFDVVGLEIDHWLDVEARRALGLEELDVPGKLPTRAAVSAPSSAPLVAVVSLGFEAVTTPRLTRQRGVAAVAALLPQVVRFVVDEPDVQRRELEILAELVERVPVLRLERPRDLARLSETAAVVADLARGSKST